MSLVVDPAEKCVTSLPEKTGADNPSLHEDDEITFLTNNPTLLGLVLRGALPRSSWHILSTKFVQAIVH